MTTVTITMSATPLSPESCSIPTNISFSPAGQLEEHNGTTIVFKVDTTSNLLSYIEDSGVMVTLTWNGVDYPLTDGADTSFPIGQSNIDYSLTVGLNLVVGQCSGENSTTTSGEIIVT
jgi:hypothetical protein